MTAMESNPNTGRLDSYRPRYAIEIALTRKVLLALADADLSYRSHERNPSAGDIISTIVKGLEIRNGLAELGHVDISPRPSASYQTLVRDLTSFFAALSARLFQLDQQQWEEPSQLRFGERVVLEQPLGQIMCYFTSILFTTVASYPRTSVQWTKV